MVWIFGHDCMVCQMPWKLFDFMWVDVIEKETSVKVNF